MEREKEVKIERVELLGRDIMICLWLYRVTTGLRVGTFHGKHTIYNTHSSVSELP